MKKRVFFIVIFMIIVVALAILFRSHNQYILLQGEVDTAEVIITSKARGRVTEIHVDRGDDVKKGTLLITLESPELLSQVNAAEAVRDQAQAQLSQSISGTREESIRSLEAVLAQAKLAYSNADKEYQRNRKIASQGFVSASNLDSLIKARDTAKQQINAAQANLDEAKHGDRIEQKQRLQAAVRQAEAQLLQLVIQKDDLSVKAPVDGEVGVIAAEIGELFNAGSPLLTLTRLDDAYFIFNLREDILAKIRKGDKISLQVPALGNEMVEAEVRYISPVGDFATKRATRATGDFDLKTFEVRLYPTSPVAGLRAGMSAIWKWE